MREIVKLLPACKDYVWGGDKLARDWNKPAEVIPLAECWELSLHPDGLCRVGTGAAAGKTLAETLEKEDIGSRAAAFPFFPVLIKLLDAKQDLSVQVHPSDEYALKNEGSFGKTEMWVVLDAEPGAGIRAGFRRKLTKEEFARALAEERLTEELRFFEVKKGERYFIPAGTVHAIGAGVTVCEIQQNSNLTYRVYDYGRKGADGKPRPLHAEKAAEVADLFPYTPLPAGKEEDGVTLLADCPYFNVCAVRAGDRLLHADPTSFHALTVTGGEGKIGDLAAKKGDTFFVPAGYGAYRASGVDFLLTRV